MDLYVMTVEFICGLGVVTNPILLFIVIRCPLKVFVASKYFFIFVSIQNSIMAICYFILAPWTLVYDGSYLFLATGKGSKWEVAPALLLVYNTTLISTLVFSTNSFVYRFIQLCRRQWFFIYTSIKCLALYGVLDIALISNWVLMIYFIGWPNSAFLNYVQQYMISKYNFTVNSHAFVGFSIELLTNGHFAFLIESLVLLLVLAGIAFCCALRIHFYLKGNSISSQTKKIQKTMLIILLIQTACPVILLHVPLLAMFLMLFAGWNTSPAISCCRGILMSAYPFFSPIIIMFYMKDYRRFILRLFGLEKHGSSATTTLFVTETACPVILLHVPLLAMLLMSFTGWNATLIMGYCSGILMSAYPFFSPTIIVFYMKDYRRFLFRLFRSESGLSSGKTTVFVAAADGKTCLPS